MTETENKHYESFAEHAGHWHGLENLMANITNPDLRERGNARVPAVEHYLKEMSEYYKKQFTSQEVEAYKRDMSCEQMVPVVEAQIGVRKRDMSKYFKENLEDIVKSAPKDSLENNVLLCHPAKEPSDKFKSIAKKHNTYHKIVEQIATYQTGQSTDTNHLREILLKEAAERDKAYLISKGYDMEDKKDKAIINKAQQAAQLLVSYLSRDKEALVERAKHIAQMYEKEIKDELKGNEIKYIQENLTAQAEKDSDRAAETFYYMTHKRK